MSTPLTKEQQELASDPQAIQKALTIARIKAKKLPWLYDELQSAAMLGLVDAARNYEPDRKVPFASYAALKARYAIRDALRGMQGAGLRRRKEIDDVLIVSLDELTEHGVTAIDSLLVDEHCGPIGWELEYQDEVEWFAQMLPLLGKASKTPTLMRDVFRSTHLDPSQENYRDLSKKHQVAVSRVHQLYTKAIRYIRRRIEQ